MRLLPLLALVSLTGCDAFSDPAVGFMSTLDGTWTRTVTQETVAPDGTVTPSGEPRVDVYEVGQRVQCAVSEFDAVGDTDRIAAAYAPQTPDSRSCDVLSVDGDARRIILIGGGLDDRAGTIDEAGDRRQVWRFYTLGEDGSVLRSLWTLTR